MVFLELWSFWSWFGAIISQILCIMAARSHYWHVTAYAMLEISHCINIAVTFCVWCILAPYMGKGISNGKKDEGAYMQMMRTKRAYDHYANRDANANELGMNAFMAWEIAINIYVHILPLIMTSVNIYYTDI